MDSKSNGTEKKLERNFPTLQLIDCSADESTVASYDKPILVIQSPKTPTLSRKLKAASLDSDPKECSTLEVCRDVFSMPNTPKKQLRQKLSCEFLHDSSHKSTLAPSFTSNLKKFASNVSISGSQTLKTLPEVMTLQDFSDLKPGPVRVKAKGLLERRGSNASLTIDLGSNSSISEQKVAPLLKLNTAKSVSNLNLSTFECADKCSCIRKLENEKRMCERRKSQEACGNCIIYESIPSKANGCNTKCQALQRRCSCCRSKCRRKSLSNENLYIPPCGFCQTGAFKECIGSSKHCKGYRKAYYPRQPDIEASQLLSEDFKLHLQNIQYLQTAGNVMSVQELKMTCEISRVPKLHQEFWEIPLNLQEKCYVSGSQTKNRYRGVLPNEHSRVQLPGSHSYIHANYIKGPDYTETAYIATQGPMTHTCHDFWDMIWTVNCNIIVMLTGLAEKGKNKCELYFPLGQKSNPGGKSSFYVRTIPTRDKFTFDGKHDDDEEVIEFEALDSISFDNYKVKYVREEVIGHCTLRHLELSNRERTFEGARKIRHYWFTNWQDHKMANPHQVLDVALHVMRSIEKRDNHKKSFDNNSSNDISKSKKSDDSFHKIVQSNGKHSTNHKKHEQANFYVDLKTDTKSSLTLGAKSGPAFCAKSGLSLGAKSAAMFSPMMQLRRKSAETLKIPLVVHCSAGIGRTGCFLAILNGIQQLKNNFNVDVLAILCSLRLNRGGMVQTAEQYELIHRVLNLFTEKM